MQLEMILAPEEFDRFRSEDTRPGVPTDYRVRTYRAGDEGQYLALMRRVGFGWDEKTLSTTLNTMLPDGLFFIEHIPTAAIVASTVAGHGSSDFHPAAGELGWVAVDPEHRGKRLGIVVCDEVLRRFIAAGYKDIILHTDEFRLPAIKTYLNLNFKPLMRNAELEDRWRIVFENLGLSNADLEACAVVTVRDESSRDGYRQWTTAAGELRSGDAGSPSEKLRIGLLPLYLALYDEHRPDLRSSVERFRDRVLKTLSEIAPARQIELIDVPIATKRGDIDVASRRFSDARVELLLTLHLAYSPSLLAADLLANVGVPILVLDTTPSAVFDLDNDAYMIENHGVHGVMDLTSVLRSKGVQFSVCAGHIDDPCYVDRLTAEIEGALMAKRFKNQKIGVTGAPFVGMGDFAVRTDSLLREFGIQTAMLSPELIVATAGEITDEDVIRTVSDDASMYDVSRIGDAVHKSIVRNYLAIKKLCGEYGLSGYTMNFEHTGPSLPPPFYAVSRLMVDGIGYAGESDVMTACLGRVLGSVSGRSMFSEVFCVDWTGDEIMFSHMGEINPAFAGAAKPQIVEKLALGHEHASAYFRFAIEPMRVTLVNVGVTDGLPTRIVGATLDLLDHAPAPGVDAPHFFAKPSMPVREFLEAYGRLGGGHHVYLVEGDLRPQLGIMCSRLGLCYEEVR